MFHQSTLLVFVAISIQICRIHHDAADFSTSLNTILTQMKTLTRRLKTVIKTSLNEQLYIEELAKQTFFLEEKEGGSKNSIKLRPFMVIFQHCVCIFRVTLISSVASGFYAR